MCKITNEGYQMKDGAVIPFKKLEIGDVSPEHIEELNKSYATVWDVVLLRNTIFSLREDIKKDVGEQIGKLTKTFGEHGSYCPANKEKVKDLVNEVIEDRTDLKITRGKKYFDLIWKAAIVFIVLLNIYLYLKGKSPIQITP